MMMMMHPTQQQHVLTIMVICGYQSYLAQQHFRYEVLTPLLIRLFGNTIISGFL
jgi:hypothetical protein